MVTLTNGYIDLDIRPFASGDSSTGVALSHKSGTIFCVQRGVVAVSRFVLSLYFAKFISEHPLPRRGPPRYTKDVVPLKTSLNSTQKS